MWNRFYSFSKRIKPISFNYKPLLPSTLLCTGIITWASDNMELSVPTKDEVLSSINKINKRDNTNYSYNSLIDKYVDMLDDNDVRETSMYMDELINNFGNLHNKIVIDVGSGTGYFTKPLSHSVGKDGLYIGLDVNEPFVYYLNEKTSKNKNIKIGLNNTESLCLPNELKNSCDMIIISLTLHHMSNANKILSECYEYLKPNGKIIIIEFTEKGRHEVTKMLEKKNRLNLGGTDFDDDNKHHHGHSHGHSHGHKHGHGHGHKHKHRGKHGHHKHSYSGHTHFYSVDDLQRELTEAGFIFERYIMKDLFTNVFVAEFKKPCF